MIDTGATFMTRLRNEIEADSTVRNAQNQMILPAILDSVEELTGVMSQTPPPASPADFSSNLGLRVRDGEMEEMYYSPFVLHVWRGQTHMLAPPTYISLESLGIQRAQQLCLSMPFPADLPTLQVRWPAKANCSARDELRRAHNTSTEDHCRFRNPGLI